MIEKYGDDPLDRAILLPRLPLLSCAFQASYRHILWGRLMKITTITAVSLILASGLGSGAFAQLSSKTAQPAEFPPASYQGRQYVDSRGCIFIRAGVDGNVAWIPRVNRARQQLCGAEPSNIAGSTRQQPSAQDPRPDIITLAPDAGRVDEPAPVRVTPPPAVRSRSTTPSTAIKPERTAAMTSTDAKNVALSPARPARATPPKPQRAAAAPAPAAPTVATVPRTRLRKSGDPLAQITPNTRILPVHVYLLRRESDGLQVPAGYRPAWEDDRLNIHRVEQTIRPTVINEQPAVPEGYILAERSDNRMNTRRAQRTQQGDQQMAQIWTDNLPRRQVEQSLDKTPFILWDAKAKYGIVPPRRGGPVTTTRISSRAAPDATLPEVSKTPATPRYVRAATLANTEEAKRVARELSAATGLQMRLGTLNRNGQTLKVVLAGPFTAGADQALQRIRAAGFSRARLSK
ncbi:SPOR domain-containing protein [Epibacterium mobile]|nr:SPOR domain-containing protein [Tritonibacter mobilis]